MKTVKEWFESIKDEDVRRRALANMKYPDVSFHHLALALSDGFYWGATEEGMDYWHKKYIDALMNKL